MQIPPKGIYGVGHYLCHIGVIVVDAETVASWLPPEIELDDQNITPKGTHPVNLLFGKELDVHLHPFSFANIDYGEFAVVVPFTRWKSKDYRYRGPFLFTPLLYLDNWAGIEAGRILYGFPKKRAKFNITDNFYEVIEDDTNVSIVECQIEKYIDVPNQKDIDNIARLIQQPSLSQKTDGSYVGSGFWWDIPKAKITAEKAQVNFTNWWMPTLPDSNPRILELDGVSDFSKGGFYHIDTVWTLTLPQNPDKDWSPYLFKGVD